MKNTTKINGQVIVLDNNWWKRERISTNKTEKIVKQPILKSNSPLLSVKEIAKRLNVGIWGIYDYTNSGELSCQMVGKRKRISEEALEEFLYRQNQRKGMLR